MLIAVYLIIAAYHWDLTWFTLIPEWEGFHRANTVVVLLGAVVGDIFLFQINKIRINIKRRYPR